ncbi:MAG: xanthine dehydrogenase family protein, partial [Gemmatimonadetes bacterium]|nr:xanthine dehydrogenase family protein [Gemmatimonadota bacterium]
MSVVGTSVPRKDGPAKVAGAALYVDDIVLPGMLYGRTIRATIPCGRIKSIRLDFDPTGFTIVDYRDIPGRNVVALIEDDQPCLVEREVRHAAEAILLLAHEDRERLLGAKVEVEYEPGTPLLDPERSTRVHKHLVIEKGDLAPGFAHADLIVEGEYRTGHQEHVYIETNGFIAVPEDGGIAVHGSLQCPYYVHKALTQLLGLPDRRVRVIQTEPGGGFGGKEEYPSMIAGHAALLALKAKRPVKIVYDRAEDMWATTKRHPSIVRHRTGVTAKGGLVAMEVEVLLDGGAYVTLSPVVLSRGCIHAAGPYRCDNVRIDGRAVFTNTNPNGAFRGFGAPQTEFAVEVHVDRIAERLGIDPVRLRAINALRPGDTTATGQVMGEDCSAGMVLEEAARRSGFRRKRRAFKGTNRGIGLALFFHGCGFTGSGEVRLASKCSLALTERGVLILTASTEIGQGTRTIHAQIVADTLGIPYQQVEVAVPDTEVVPDSGPTVASRTCMVVGRILQRCAEEMKQRLGGLPPDEYLRRHGPLVVTKQYEPPPGIAWDDATYRGDAYATFSWACDVAEVELDPDTYEVKVRKMTAVHEFGRPIHPVLARGQIEGGTAQGVGYALIEHVVMNDGAMANAQLTNYTIPTTLDTPAMNVVMLENPYP